jgi:5'-3' exonuclease
MGIPSYYRRLLRDNPGLVKRTQEKPVDWLWMDFNCLIYHCLRRPDLRPYPGSEGKEEWEADFLKAIVAYTQKVVGEVKPTKGVYIGIDGVVPMAKMKQQRMRRFKSSWLTENGLAEGQTAGIPKWDTNAITPGTLFMGKLRKALEEVARRKKWTVSSSDEPGEGEHKVMAQIRGLASSATGAVYGLDADLIVLSLLTQDTMAKGGKTVDLWLFREQVEDGSLVRNSMGEEVFQWFSIGGLRDILSKRVTIREYCFAMSFLGNDFLPASLGLKMRDDGHDVLLDVIGPRMESLLKDDEIDGKGLSGLLKALAKEEERRIGIFVSKKLSQGSRFVGLELGHEDWPMSEKEELCLMAGPRLRPDWQLVYRKVFLQEADVKDTVRVYYEGLRWIWDYYRGKEICYNWYYPWSLPPLWSEIANGTGVNSVPVVVRGSDIQPVEQLCLVLPPASWDLIPSLKHRGLMTKAPYLFPKGFRFSSVGRRFFWECEAEIPIPSIREVKAILG